ncbi:MAG: hypothetical protein Terrestrivirus5_21 [Terrestrivirus sp.]|uniref:Uncharacterized protein n=1 Tax=Terrestrivirus sp. TaxID=2487775 RepID=A0A3G4ZS04_9VIRU|nr:MAG: hypothetical protein Terrestrivirus5_21 [Terrestrivirus sp.]
MINIYFACGNDNADGEKLREKINESPLILLHRHEIADGISLHDITDQINKADVMIIDITPDGTLLQSTDLDERLFFDEQVMFEYGYALGKNKMVFIIYNKNGLITEFYEPDELYTIVGSDNVFPYENIEEIYNMLIKEISVTNVQINPQMFYQTEIETETGSDIDEIQYDKIDNVINI